MCVCAHSCVVKTTSGSQSTAAGDWTFPSTVCILRVNSGSLPLRHLDSPASCFQVSFFLSLPCHPSFFLCYKGMYVY